MSRKGQENTLSTKYLQKRKFRDKFKKIVFSDEAHYDTNNYVKNQNWHIWESAMPKAVVHPKRRTAWVVFWRGLFGPCFIRTKFNLILY